MAALFAGSLFQSAQTLVTSSVRAANRTAASRSLALRAANAPWSASPHHALLSLLATYFGAALCREDIFMIIDISTHTHPAIYIYIYIWLDIVARVAKIPYLCKADNVHRLQGPSRRRDSRCRDPPRSKPSRRPRSRRNTPAALRPATRVPCTDRYLSTTNIYRLQQNSNKKCRALLVSHEQRL